MALMLMHQCPSFGKEVTNFHCCKLERETSLNLILILSSPTRIRFDQKMLLGTLLILLSLEYDTNKYQVKSDYRITNQISQKCRQIFGPFPPTM